MGKKMRDEIIINGKKYDAITVELLSDLRKNRNIELKDISKIHNNLQRSNTLNRRYVSVPRRQRWSPNQEELINQFKRRHDYQEAILRAREAKETQQDRILISRFSKDSKIISPISKKQLEEADQIAPFEEHPLAKKQMKNLGRKGPKNKKFQTKK